MTNVINIFQNARKTLLEQIRGEIDYDVIALEHTYKNPITGQETATGRKDLVNGNTGNFISNMSDGYAIVQNVDIFEELDQRIAESGLDITGAQTFVDVQNDGGSVAVRYVFPAHSIDVGNGDKTSLMITAINSFNGSTGFAIYLGGFRGYCMNTQVFGTTVVGYRKKHTRNLCIKKAVDIIRKGIDVFMMEGEIWKEMTKRTVSREKAFVALADYADIDLAKTPTLESYLLERRAQGMKKVAPIENYLRIFDEYVSEMGNSEFALYNTLTHIATHGAAKSGKKVPANSTYETRMSGVRKVIQKHCTAYAKAA